VRWILLALALVVAPLAPSTAFAQGDEVRAEADALYERGLERFAEGKVPIAAAHFRAALDIDPGHGPARSRLVECLVLLDEVDEARRIAQGGQPAPGAPAAESPGIVSEAEPVGGGELRPLEPLESDAPMTDEEAAARREEAARIQAAAQARNRAREEALRAVEEARRAEEEALRAEEDARRVDEERRRAAERAARNTPAAKAERRARRNPRSLGKLGAAFALGGSTMTVGGVVQLKPHWLGSLDVGLGGFFALDGGRPVPAVALSVEGQLTPVPWRLTPVIGGGVTILAGSGAPYADAVLWSPTTAGRARVVPFGTVGARYDFRKRVWFSVTARVAPGASGVPVPLPGARIGLRF